MAQDVETAGQGQELAPTVPQRDAREPATWKYNEAGRARTQPYARLAAEPDLLGSRAGHPVFRSPAAMPLTVSSSARRSCGSACSSVPASAAASARARESSE